MTPGRGRVLPPQFRLAAVWFESNELVQSFTDGIAALRIELGLSAGSEFHFTHLNGRRRAEFFKAIASHRFSFAFSAFEKSAFKRKTPTKDLIREETVGGLVKHMREWYLIAKACKDGTAGLGERIVYDVCDDPSYAKILKAQFRSLSSGRGTNKKLIGDVNPRKAKRDSYIQLADMVCGAVGRHLTGESDYYNLFKHKEIAIEIVKKAGRAT